MAAKKKASRKSTAKPKLLSGGNPGAKLYGKKR